ncbi:MAG: ribonuclease III [Spirochaetes bacterium]|nr:ribonuclease III [Spirochaetota bacterium]
MTQQRKKELKEFLKKNKIRFANYELLNLALSHKSFINERKTSGDNNEKLEFLGDSVLGLIITEYLYKNLTDYSEGDLARIKSFIVSEESLSQIGKYIELNQYLLVGKGEELTGGRNKKAIIADTFEALLGAYYLDTGLAKVRDFVIKLFRDEIKKVVDNQQGKDYKTLLQEYIQKQYKDCPTYRLIEERGPEHNKIFYMEVLLGEKILGKGEGRSKKEAEKSSAKNAYLKLKSTSIHTSKKKK